MVKPSGSALIIEDDDDIRRLLEVVLQQSGFTVESATTGAEGLERADTMTARVITVDVGLPDVDGYEVVRRLRGSFDGHIVMISARSTDADRAAGLTAGADAYLTKPFRPRALRAALQEVLASPAGPDANPED